LFLPQELIRKKRDGGTLTEAETAAFFGGFLRGDVADYQVAAMLMAIFARGMERAETAALTRIMRDSGAKLAWNFPKNLIVDKHSTGGIGDKTSLLVLPLALVAGLKVPMIAGRGLGHTGGTLDKLEAVGFKVYQDEAALRRQVETLGGAFLGQTEALVPLDRRLYALRDVTATVESIPLIVGSILSKKAAAGLGGLVMDVKFGSGAFMADYEQALTLARAIADVGNECGMKVRCLLTSMNQPLGDYAGNALEVFECLEILRGRGPRDTRELSLELTAEMVRLAFPERRLDAARRELEGYLASGEAYEMFCRIAKAQGADTAMFERREAFFAAKIKTEVGADVSAGAVVAAIDTRKLGLAIVELGGGRKFVTDKIEPAVGLSGMKRIGDRVAQGEPLAVVHGQDESRVRHAAKLVAEAYRMGERVTTDILIRVRV
jgi:pyrimidine-nucleoside phosphorylase